MPAKANPRATALAGTLHDAETRQLAEFIAKRSKTLDSDINEMRKRLGSRISGESAAGLPSGTFSAALSDSMKVDGHSLLTHAQGSVTQEQFDQQETQNAATFRATSITPAAQPRAATMRDRLGTFLARIKISKWSIISHVHVTPHSMTLQLTTLPLTFSLNLQTRRVGRR